MFRKKKLKKKENLTYYFSPFSLFSESDSPSFLGLFYTIITSEYVTSVVSICKGRYKIGKSKMFVKWKSKCFITSAKWKLNKRK